jgi:hypothetical protein
MNNEKALVFGLLVHSFGAVLPVWFVVVTSNLLFLQNRNSGRYRCRRRRETSPIDSPGGRSRITLGNQGNHSPDTRPEASE